VSTRIGPETLKVWRRQGRPNRTVGPEGRTDRPGANGAFCLSGRLCLSRDLRPIQGPPRLPIWGPRGAYLGTPRLETPRRASAIWDSATRRPGPGGSGRQLRPRAAEGGQWAGGGRGRDRASRPTGPGVPSDRTGRHVRQDRPPARTGGQGHPERPFACGVPGPVLGTRVSSTGLDEDERFVSRERLVIRGAYSY
jgi:hypothetical protein